MVEERLDAYFWVTNRLKALVRYEVVAINSVTIASSPGARWARRQAPLVHPCVVVEGPINQSINNKNKIGVMSPDATVTIAEALPEPDPFVAVIP
jgi:hypothetical protein